VHSRKEYYLILLKGIRIQFHASVCNSCIFESLPMISFRNNRSIVLTLSSGSAMFDFDWCVKTNRAKKTWNSRRLYRNPSARIPPYFRCSRITLLLPISRDIGSHRPQKTYDDSEETSPPLTPRHHIYPKVYRRVWKRMTIAREFCALSYFWHFQRSNGRVVLFIATRWTLGKWLQRRLYSTMFNLRAPGWFSLISEK